MNAAHEGGDEQIEEIDMTSIRNMTSIGNRAVFGFAIAAVAVGLAATPNASASSKDLTECMKGATGPVFKSCCIYAGGTYGGTNGGSGTEETCTFSGNALSSDANHGSPTTPPKTVVHIRNVPAQAQVRA